jgi:hypothetical protein
MTDPWKMRESGQKGGTLASPLMHPHPTFNITAERGDNSLMTQGGTGKKPCFMTIDTRADVTIARPDVIAGWP